MLNNIPVESEHFPVEFWIYPNIGVYPTYKFEFACRSLSILRGVAKMSGADDFPWGDDEDMVDHSWEGDEDMVDNPDQVLSL